MSITAQGFAKLHSNKIRSGYQKTIINFLAWRANDDGLVWWSLKRIANELLYDLKTVRKWINQSIKDGIIAIKSINFGKTKSTRAYQFVTNNHGVQNLEGVPNMPLGRGTKNDFFSRAYNRMKKHTFKKQEEDRSSSFLKFADLRKQEKSEENKMASNAAYRDLNIVKKMNDEKVNETRRELLTKIFKKTEIEVIILEKIITENAIDLYNDKLDPEKFVDYFIYYAKRCATTCYKLSEKGFLGFIIRETSSQWIKDDILPELPQRPTVYSMMSPKMREAYSLARDRKKGLLIETDKVMGIVGEFLYGLMDREAKEIKENDYFEFDLNKSLRTLFYSLCYLPENPDFSYTDLMVRYQVQDD